MNPRMKRLLLLMAIAVSMLGNGEHNKALADWPPPPCYPNNCSGGLGGAELAPGMLAAAYQWWMKKIASWF